VCAVHERCTSEKEIRRSRRAGKLADVRGGRARSTMRSWSSIGSVEVILAAVTGPAAEWCEGKEAKSRLASSSSFTPS
jgi:hypothetical protein